MPPDTLEFEEPIAVLQKQIEALSLMPQTPEQQRPYTERSAEWLAALVKGEPIKPHAAISTEPAQGEK